MNDITEVGNTVCCVIPHRLYCLGNPKKKVLYNYVCKPYKNLGI